MPAIAPPGKGNTLVSELHRFSKLSDHNAFLPGTRIPFFPEKTAGTKPDYVPVLRWNLRDEMMLSALILAAEAPI